MLINAEPLLKPDKKIQYVIATYHDLTERKVAEDTVKRREAELERSNAELQQFAYVASHDLQEPLRMIASYVQLLQKRYKGKLDSDADEFIYYAADGAKRMQMLIHDLLEYSRISTRGGDFAPVSMQAALTKVIENYRLLLEETGATLIHDTLPVVNGDIIQISQLFQNLIENAIKYSGKELPFIRITVTQKSNYYRFAVSDNGIGIDPAYFDKLFQIFKRLHSSAEYEGTGIGLAVCKRVVERHGGKIWVESQPGSGSTFYLTIPVPYKT